MENPQLYSNANGMQRRDAEDVIMEFCDRMKWTDGARVLDVGCGTGEVTAATLLPKLPKSFEQLIGVDISHKLIKFARKAHKHPKIKFVQFDIAQETENILEELEAKLENNNNNNGVGHFDSDDRVNIVVDERSKEDKYRMSRGYDVISSFYCLHWITNQKLALANIYDLLKPGGDALLVLLAKSSIFSLYDKLSSFPMWKEYMQDVENFISPYHRSEDPLKDFLDLVTNVGFETINMECRERNYIFQSTSNLKNAIIAVNPFISRIPNHLRRQFMNDFMKEIEELKLSERKNNCHKVTYKLLVAHIRRTK